MLDSGLLTTAVASEDLLITDNFFQNELSGYNIVKFFTNKNSNQSVPLLFGFFSTHLKLPSRPLHNVAFLTPINEDPSSQLAATTCLSSTKEMLLDTNYQSESHRCR